MQNSWKTPEFWAALLGQVIGIAVLVGGITAEEGENVNKALQAIIGGVLSLGTILGFIKAQGTRKLAAVNLAVAKLSQVARDPAGAKSASAADDLMSQI